MDQKPSQAFGKHSKKKDVDHMDIDEDEKILKSSIEFSRVDFLGKLPVEIAHKIISYIPAETLPPLALTCRGNSRLVKDNKLWETKFKENRHWQLKQISKPSYTIDWYWMYKNRMQLQKNWLNFKPKVSTIRGHEDSVYCVQFWNDILVSGSRDQTIKFWHVKDQRLIKVLTGHTGSILCLRFDNEILVTGSSDMSVMVWDWQNGKVLYKFTHHTSGVLDVAIDDEFIVSSSKDHTIKTYDRKTGKLLYNINAHNAAVNAISLKNKQLVSGSGDYAIKVWDIYTGGLLKEIRGHSRGIACLQFDGETIVSGSNDMYIKVWNAKTGEMIASCKQHKELVRTLDFNKDFIITGSYDQSIILWNRKTYKPIKVIERAHDSWVFNLAIGQTKFLSSSQDNAIKIWNFEGKLDCKYFEN